MAIKDLIVIVDDSLGSASRVETALVMARKYNAHLTGVYIQNIELLSPERMRDLPSSHKKLAPDHVNKSEKEASTQAEQNFQEQTAAAEWGSKSDWRLIHGNPNDIVSTISRYADLVLVGQAGPASGNTEIVDPGVVVSTSGRPMLVVPQEFKPKGFSGEHVVLGWNGSREAASAIADSISIIETKTKVSILTFQSPADLPECFNFDIGVYLSRHGVQAEYVDLKSRSGDHGMDIVNFAVEHKADLIVMGAYTSSRLTQSIFGGATRTVLANMKTPVFLSH